MRSAKDLFTSELRVLQSEIAGLKAARAGERCPYRFSEEAYNEYRDNWDPRAIDTAVECRSAAVATLTETQSYCTDIVREVHRRIDAWKKDLLRDVHAADPIAAMEEAFYLGGGVRDQYHNHRCDLVELLDRWRMLPAAFLLSPHLHGGAAVAEFRGCLPTLTENVFPGRDASPLRVEELLARGAAFLSECRGTCC